MPSPVKQRALDLNLKIPIYSPDRASTPEFAETLKSHEPDLFVVVAYGEIIKQNLLDIPKLDPINIHASLLPKYRGAAPMQRALMAGEEETGITIIEMVLKMDAGPMLAEKRVPIGPETTLGELEEAMYRAACAAIDQVLVAYQEGTVQKTEQQESAATFANKITPEELEIDWRRPGTALHNLIRSVSPKPAAWTTVKTGSETKRLKIKKTRYIHDLAGVPGATLQLEKGRWIVATGEGALELLEVQLEGKKALPTDLFLKGIHAPLRIL